MSRPDFTEICMEIYSAYEYARRKTDFYATEFTPEELGYTKDQWAEIFSNLLLCNKDGVFKIIPPSFATIYILDNGLKIDFSTCPS